MVCISSLALERVNIWRNPQGREENWSESLRYVSLFSPVRDKSAKYREVQLIKATIGQCASFIILQLAVIETVAYAALSVISLVFLTYNDTPYAISRKLLSSSFFTIVWVFSKLQFTCLPPNFREQRALSRVISIIKAVNSFFLGRVFQNEPTHESFARKKYIPRWFFRREDREAIIQKINPDLSKEWIRNYLADERNLDYLRSVEHDPILLKDVFLQVRFLKALQQQHANQDEQYTNQSTAVIDNRAHEDKRIYQCAIGFDLLNENTAVQDPTSVDGENPTFYNLPNIEEWLKRSPTSPVTRGELYLNGLIHFAEMKPEHQEGIRKAQQRGAVRY